MNSFGLLYTRSFPTPFDALRPKNMFNIILYAKILTDFDIFLPSSLLHHQNTAKIKKLSLQILVQSENRNRFYKIEVYWYRSNNIVYIFIVQIFYN